MDDALFADLLQSVRDIGRMMRGEPVAGAKMTEVQDIKTLRESVQVTQAEFARLIGVSRRTLENWERRRTELSGPVKALLRIVSADPESALRALHTVLRAAV